MILKVHIFNFFLMIILLKKMLLKFLFQYRLFILLDCNSLFYIILLIIHYLVGVREFVQIIKIDNISNKIKLLLMHLIFFIRVPIIFFRIKWTKLFQSFLIILVTFSGLVLEVLYNKSVKNMLGKFFFMIDERKVIAIFILLLAIVHKL